MSEMVTGELCRVVLMELLPAVQNGDFQGTSEALHEFGHKVGEYFAPVQGGIFSDTLMQKVYQYLRGKGVAGICQSSWGPTTAVLCRSDAHAQEVLQNLRTAEWEKLTTQVVSPLNTGAALEFPGVRSHDISLEADEAGDVGQ